MLPEDWKEVFSIYKKEIDSGRATFSTQYPTWEEWNVTHHKNCRYVADLDGRILGFCTVSPVSTKPHYSGVMEVMVYVDEKFRQKGVGTALLQKLIEEAPKNGIWSLYSSIFSSNESSITLHLRCGFRIIGYREKIAKDRFGSWTDTVLLEYRFPEESK